MSANRPPHKRRCGLVALGMWLGVTMVSPASSQTTDSFNPVANNIVSALAVQADGKILVGGAFTSMGGQPRTNLARLNADGTLDASFNSAANGPVFSLVVQPDGKILVGGSFSELSRSSRQNIGRLNGDGSMDSAFNSYANGEVRALALQADGMIVVGGGFSSLGGPWCYGLGRLNPDGTLESSFLSSSIGGNVSAVAIQADGKILMGGSFGGQIVGVWRYRMARWQTNGVLDQAFNPGEFSHNSASVDALAVQADGKILVGGTFTNLAGQACYRIARVNESGSFDSSFNLGANAGVTAFAVQADGGILVGGVFTTMSGQPRDRIARLKADGTLDDSFNPGASGAVTALAIQADGKILVSGGFTNLAGQPRAYLGRLNNSAPATHVLSRGASIVTWFRDSTAPEVWRASFEQSTNGVTWTGLVSAGRISGGWQATGVVLLAEVTIRARGQVTGGLGNGSGWLVEDYDGRPVCLRQPANRTNNAGTTVTFSVWAGGTEPLAYRWRKNGAPLADDGKLAGSLTATLSISDAQKSDEGDYSVVVTNVSGSVTSIVATLTVDDPGVIGQPVSLNRELGEAATLSVAVVGTAPFSFQWWKDGVLLPQRTNAVLTLTNLQIGDAGSYTVVVTNISGAITSAPALLTVNASILDTGFIPGDSPNVVYPVAVQSDGKVLVGGYLLSAGSLYRLNTGGALDSLFTPNATSTVKSLAIQPDGRIVVAGDFNSLGWLTRNCAGRVNADGTLDWDFDPTIGGVSRSVDALAIQADGKILVGGYFTTVGGQLRTNLARLNTNGTLDVLFNPAPNQRVSALAVQADGKILLAGWFTAVGGQLRTNLARLHPDGTPDDAFNSDVLDSTEISTVAVQVDGKILVGGTFSTLAGQPRTNLARLNANGTIDGGFNPGADHDNVWQGRAVNSLMVQSDGRILVGGDFSILGGQSRNCLGRLNPDGTLDATFNPGTGGPNLYVNSLAVQADGKIVVGGSFTTLGGQARTNIGRLMNTGPATDNLSRDGTGITWLRGGAAPEVWRTTFEHSVNGVAWSNLGDGLRIPGGWQLTNLALPAGGTIRARGHVVGGFHNASGSWVETLIGAPIFVTQPSSRTINFGTTATFNVVADGPMPLNFQWLKAGIPVLDGNGIGGALTPILTLTNVSKFAEGDYRVVITNASGSITSAVATLTVIDPVLTGQSIGGYREIGQSATFTVTAAGTGLAYQWSKDGAPLPQATNPSLVLTNIQLSDAGTYRAVVTGTFGSVTSILGTLTVNAAGLDTNFNANVNGWVSPVVVQTDGKIIFGGGFTTVGGQSRGRVARVSINGVLDTTFANPNANDDVYALALQPDGKLVVGGQFTTLGGQMRSALGRLNTNGALDTTFSTTVFNPGPAPPIYSYRAQAILLQPDGKIIVGGRATATISGQPFIGGFLLRLNTNGVSDATFSTGGVSGGPVSSLAWQPDGKILVGGMFSSVGGQTRNRIARLNPNGALDLNFNPGLAAPSGINPVALAMMVQPDGKIVVGGAFTTIAGQSQTNLARLHENGNLDDTFRPVLGATYPDLQAVVLQSDGRILVGGLFNSLNGVSRTRLGRLNADGTLDISFNPGANSDVYGLALQPDGRVLVTGFFSQLAGQTRSYLARLNNTEPASQSLSYSNTTVLWSRGGTSPEIWRTTFESSTNGTNWVLLGSGTRSNGGWQFTASVLPPGGTVRARGFTAGGGYNAASWFAESRLIITPLLIANDGQLGFQSNRFSFSVSSPRGAAVVIEASTNFVHWSPILTNLVGDVGVVLVQDLNSGLYPRRYYRARFHLGTLPPPTFLPGTTGMQNGQFGFSLGGVAGQVVVIAASTNLTDWTALNTNALGLEGFWFRDSDTTNFPARFYRTQLQ